MKIFETIKELIRLKKRFPAYSWGTASLWYWEKILRSEVRKGFYPGHSPSDPFTRSEAEKYFIND